MIPADVHHTYGDKYNLAEWLTNLSLAAELNCLDMLGLEQTRLATLRGWAATQNVTLRLQSEERCSFSREEERVEEDIVSHEQFGGEEEEAISRRGTAIAAIAADLQEAQDAREMYVRLGAGPVDLLHRQVYAQAVQDVEVKMAALRARLAAHGRGADGITRSFGKTSTTHVIKFTDYCWTYEVQYSLLAFRGPSPSEVGGDNCLVLLGRTASGLLWAAGVDGARPPAPRPPVRALSPADVNITWLLARMLNTRGSRLLMI